MVVTDPLLKGTRPPKIPVSVLVVMFSAEGRFLLIERADKLGYWQSVTGSLDLPDEEPAMAAARELLEETGFSAVVDKHNPPLDEMQLDSLALPGFIRAWPKQHVYEIFEHWRHRYEPGVTHNTEHWFYVCLPDGVSPLLNPREHVGYQWLSAQKAIEKCFSPSNAEAIQELANKWQISGK